MADTNHLVKQIFVYSDGSETVVNFKLHEGFNQPVAEPEVAPEAPSAPEAEVQEGAEPEAEAIEPEA